MQFLSQSQEKSSKISTKKSFVEERNWWGRNGFAAAFSFRKDLEQIV